MNSGSLNRQILECSVGVELQARVQHQILQKQRELPDGLSPVMAGVPLVVMDGVRRICVGGSVDDNSLKEQFSLGCSLDKSIMGVRLARIEQAAEVEPLGRPLLGYCDASDIATSYFGDVRSGDMGYKAFGVIADTRGNALMFGEQKHGIMAISGVSAAEVGGFTMVCMSVYVRKIKQQIL